MTMVPTGRIGMTLGRIASLSLFFVYRSPYAGPTGKRVRRLDADTILEWFRRSWDVAARGQDEDEWATSARRWVEAELGFDVYDLWSIFAAVPELALSPPESDDQLADYLSKYLGVEGSVLVSPRAIQAHTNDDELELVYYLFDEPFAREHPEATAYLLHERWRLPAASEGRAFTPDIKVPELLPRGVGSGTTYLVFLGPMPRSISRIFRGICRVASRGSGSRTSAPTSVVPSPVPTGPSSCSCSGSPPAGPDGPGSVARSMRRPNSRSTTSRR